MLRNIHSSEIITDICSSYNVGYAKDLEIIKEFFKAIQNKLHIAIPKIFLKELEKEKNNWITKNWKK